MVKKKSLSAFFYLFLLSFGCFLNPLEALAKSGCCSWHDGVCGCSGGRQLYCDGTLSPSCTCYSPPAAISTSKPIPKKINTPTSIPTRKPTPSPIPTKRPTSTPIPTSTSTPIPTPTTPLIENKTDEDNNSTESSNSGIGWLLLAPAAVTTFLLVKGRKPI